MGMTAPDFIWAVFEEDISAQTCEVYAQCEPEGFVEKPTKYLRADLDAQELLEIMLAGQAAVIREAALREAYEVVCKWWFDDGNALPQELILSLIGEKK